MNLLYDFILMGALSQITAMSLTGEFGKRCSAALKSFSNTGWFM